MNEKVIHVTHIANPVRVNAAVILDAVACYDADDKLEGAVLRLSDGRNYSATAEMCARYLPVASDYLVTQDDGYEYLNPKDVFERKYSAIPTSNRPPHQQRVIDEGAELAERLTKLSAFFEMPLFAGLDEAEQSRLRQQHHAMTCYSVILGERIAAFV